MKVPNAWAKVVSLVVLSQDVVPGSQYATYLSVVLITRYTELL